MGESATTSADLDPPPSRRNRRARVRRRTHRAQTAMVALVAVVVAASAAGLAWWGVDTIADSRGGTALDTSDRRPITVLPATPVVMLAQPAASGGLVAVTLLALAPGGSGGFVILVPPGTLADVPGLGRATLAEAWGSGGLARLGSAVESLFQISLPRSELADEAGWEALTKDVSPFEVTFANGVRVAGPNGVLETIVPAGGAPVEAGDVARILEARTPSESELARLVRHEEFWRSLLSDMGEAGADPVVVPTTAERRPGDPVAPTVALSAAEVLEGVSSGPAQVVTISTSRSGGAADGERYEADVTEVRLLAARAMPGVVSPAGEGWRVRVVNPTGDIGVLEAAASALLASGANLVIASDSRDRAAGADGRPLRQPQTPRGRPVGGRRTGLRCHRAGRRSHRRSGRDGDPGQRLRRLGGGRRARTDSGATATSTAPSPTSVPLAGSRS